MADIEYTNNAQGYQLKTGPTGMYQAGQGGDWSSVFEALARQKMKAKADADAEEKRRWNLEFGMKEDLYDDAHKREFEAKQQAKLDRVAAENPKGTAAMVDWMSVPGGKGGMMEAMPWSVGAANSGYTTDQLKAMKPQNATFAPGDTGEVQDELAEARRRQQKNKDDLDRANAFASAQNAWE